MTKGRTLARSSRPFTRRYLRSQLSHSECVRKRKHPASNGVGISCSMTFMKIIIIIIITFVKI